MTIKCSECQKDIISETLPKGDIFLCRDCFIHLSNKDILKAIKNIKQSSSRYLLTTTFINLGRNQNLVTGRGWRPVNLEKPPFNFPSPIELFNEHCTEGYGNFSDKSLGLWELKDL